MSDIIMTSCDITNHTTLLPFLKAVFKWRKRFEINARKFCRVMKHSLLDRHQNPIVIGLLVLFD